MGRKGIAKDGERTRFTSENQPEGRGRPEGAKSRSTVLKKWLTATTDIANPFTGELDKGTVEEDVVLALVTKARQGDVPAIREILDTMYGKLAEKVQIDINQLDSDIERELAFITAGSEAASADEAESEAIN